MMKHLCGYLAVPEGHPWYGKHYGDIGADVHGGLTYSEASYFGNKHRKEYLMMQITNMLASEEVVLDKDLVFPSLKPFASFYERELAEEMEMAGRWNDYPVEIHVRVWWVGFDCGHFFDVVPGREEIEREYGWESQGFPGATYKDRDYVYNELVSLARQAEEVEIAALRDSDAARHENDGVL